MLAPQSSRLVISRELAYLSPSKAGGDSMLKRWPGSLPARRGPGHVLGAETLVSSRWSVLAGQFSLDDAPASAVSPSPPSSGKDSSRAETGVAASSSNASRR